MIQYKEMKAIILSIGLIVIGVAGLFLFSVYYTPFGHFDREVSFVVSEESSPNDLYKELTEKGLVFHPLTFQIARVLRGETDPITPGGYILSREANAFELVDALKEPNQMWVTLPENATKKEIATQIANTLGWENERINKFITAYTAIQWDAFNNDLIPLFTERFSWNDAEEKAFATMGAFFSDEEYDFLEKYYVPGDYLLSKDLSRAQMANILVSRYEEVSGESLKNNLIRDLSLLKANNVKELVRGEVELLPDLVPLPPEDVGFAATPGRESIVFSTTYWNEGRGTFELVADPETRGIDGDVNRDVYQRIYRVDGEFRDHLVGNFLWHEIHLHYHYDNFIDYYLEQIDGSDVSDVYEETKATYCVRDVDPVDTTGEDASSAPTYRVCGKERQGISVGWGDSYYYTYADQELDITGVPSGTYRLRFLVNPEGLFEELSYDNNESYAIIEIDKEKETVTVLESHGG